MVNLNLTITPESFVKKHQDQGTLKTDDTNHGKIFCIVFPRHGKNNLVLTVPELCELMGGSFMEECDKVVRAAERNKRKKAGK